MHARKKKVLKKKKALDVDYGENGVIGCKIFVYKGGLKAY